MSFVTRVSSAIANMPNVIWVLATGNPFYATCLMRRLNPEIYAKIIPSCVWKYTSRPGARDVARGSRELSRLDVFDV